MAVRLIPLFLIAMAAVGYETALIRYFAVAKWSEYGYWVISIVMVGFALSGVVLALFRDAFARNGEWLLAALPACLVVTAAAGFWLTGANPFNPLELQNTATWQPQLWNIAGYYLALLPFFFLTGVFISLSFILNADRIGIVYGYDLTGAGAGAALILTAMLVVPAFNLVPLLLLPLALSPWFLGRRYRLRAGVAALVALLAAEGVLLWDNQAQTNDFKAIYAPLHTPDAKIVARILSPRGEYTLLDTFTERVDTDISNNAGMMGIGGPPLGLGLYRDGNRIATLPKPGPIDPDYAKATLAALPYELVPHARVLLVGASGGFRIAEAKALGASQIRVLEPEPVLSGALQHGLGPSPPQSFDHLTRLLTTPPLQATWRGVYDVVDLSGDFLDAAETNATAFSREALAGFMHVLAPDGMVSIPVSIRDFPTYALRLLATARAALLDIGVQDPTQHVIVYRSAWNVRVLLSRQPWTEARVAAIRAFCDERSFDVSWYPGMDVAAARKDIFNDLPAVSFETGMVVGASPDDAIADEAEAVLSGRATPSGATFNLDPVTLDRPFFYALLRLDHLGTILKRLEILPQAEVGVLVNLAVLAQAVVIAALVLLVPLAAPSRLRGGGVGIGRAVVYFPALGLGFLFIEIYLIEKASFWLSDRTAGFALVLTGMLVFSGLGAMLADRLKGHAGGAMIIACGIILAWCAALLVWLEPLILGTLGAPWHFRAMLILGVLAPVSLALGLPFPLGIGRAGNSGVLPWAWGLNGAFSVVATPAANLLAREYGFSRVLMCAAVLYAVALISFPAMRKRTAWHTSLARSHAAD
ncbi:MAG: hypothetical protein AB7F35_02200 [Acetobacteraceae bacterium]